VLLKKHLSATKTRPGFEKVLKIIRNFPFSFRHISFLVFMLVFEEKLLNGLGFSSFV
jgi:hypothetical protein